METNMKKAENYINSIKIKERYLYQQVWDEFNDIIIETTGVEDLNQHAMEYCKRTLKEKILLFEKIRRIDDVKRVVKDTARLMSILKNINDNVFGIEGFLDGFYVKINNGNRISFSASVKGKLKEIISEPNSGLSRNNIRMINKFLSAKSNNRVMFFGKDVAKYFKKKNSAIRSSANSFLNYLNPNRQKEIDEIIRGLKEVEVCIPDLCTLKNAKLNDINKVFRKIIWEVMCENNVKSVKDLKKNKKIEIKIINRLKDILPRASTMYNDIVKVYNPIMDLQERCNCRSTYALTKYMYGLIMDDLPKFVDEMENNKDVDVLEAIALYECFSNGELSDVSQYISDDDVETPEDESIYSFAYSNETIEYTSDYSFSEPAYGITERGEIIYVQSKNQVAIDNKSEDEFTKTDSECEFSDLSRQSTPRVLNNHPQVGGLRLPTRMDEHNYQESYESSSSNGYYGGNRRSIQTYWTDSEGASTSFDSVEETDDRLSRKRMRYN